MKAIMTFSYANLPYYRGRSLVRSIAPLYSGTPGFISYSQMGWVDQPKLVGKVCGSVAGQLLCSPKRNRANPQPFQEEGNVNDWNLGALGNSDSVHGAPALPGGPRSSPHHLC